MNTEMDKAAAAHELIAAFEHSIIDKRRVCSLVASSQEAKEQVTDRYIADKIILNTALCKGVPVEFDVIKEVIVESPYKPPLLGMLAIYTTGMIFGMFFGWLIF